MFDQTNKSTTRITLLLLAVAGLLGLQVILAYARPVVLPLLIAWLLSYIFGPVVDRCTKLHIPNGLSILFVLLLLVGICFLGGEIVHERINAFIAAYPKYQNRLEAILQHLKVNLAISPDLLANIDWSGKLRDLLLSVSKNFVGFFTELILVLIFLVFMLMGKPYFNNKIQRAFSPKNSQRFLLITQSISRQIGRYLTVKLLLSIVVGGLVWLILTLLDVEFAMTWAVLALVMNFIPTLGAIIASIPPILLAFIEFYPNYWPSVLCFVSLWVLHIIIGNFVEPKVMGEHLNLSPVVMLLSLIFWGCLWGFVGALLAVPITAALMIICEHVEPLRPISIMMGSGKE